MGAIISPDPQIPNSLFIEGTSSFLNEPASILDAGNSGTTMRLLSGVLAGQPFLSIITGDKSLKSRPMDRIINPLKLMGANVIGRSNGRLAPIVFQGGNLSGIEYELPVASAQLKSCLLLAGMYADGTTKITEPAPSRDHTEKMLADMGIPISVENQVITVRKGQLIAKDVFVPSDISSAAYWMVAAAAHPDSKITINGVGVNPTRTGILEILNRMNAKITLGNPRKEGVEEVADIVVESSDLVATEIDGDIIPRLIDELPVLAVAACYARGTTIIKDASELRVKESDRIKAIVSQLNRMGGNLQEISDGMVIHGPVILKGTTCRSFGDHRVAMSLAIAGTLAQGETTILNAECSRISYPGFWEQIYSISGE
jgi:3-phosphoshikimate 1-carboxyvinyltransferase